jgi:hypothetical protein
MTPEDRLDALLTALRQSEREQRRDTAAAPERAAAANGLHEPAAATDDSTLVPLVASAQRLGALRAAQPDPAFARALEARLLARATERRRHGVVALPPPAPARRDERGMRLRLPVARSAALRPALVAAAVLLALGMGTLTVAAAAAGPGSPLFGLHRLEQNVQAGAAGDSAAQARQHIEFARQWLAAVRTAAAQHLGDPTYSDALQALRDEDAAAAAAIAQLPAGTARSALETDLAALRADEKTTLAGALPAIGWPDRITTTTALGALGVAVPHVTGATMAVSDSERWQVTLTGTGFQTGAVLLVNGRPAGNITATTATSLTAELLLDAIGQPPESLGVGNPDGTAAVTNAVRVLRRDATGTSTPDEHNGTPEPEGGSTATPSSGDHEGTPSPTGTDGGSGSGGSGSPTPDH